MDGKLCFYPDININEDVLISKPDRKYIHSYAASDCWFASFQWAQHFFRCNDTCRCSVIVIEVTPVKAMMQQGFTHFIWLQSIHLTKSTQEYRNPFWKISHSHFTPFPIYNAAQHVKKSSFYLPLQCIICLQALNMPYINGFQKRWHNEGLGFMSYADARWKTSENYFGQTPKTTLCTQHAHPPYKTV